VRFTSLFISAVALVTPTVLFGASAEVQPARREEAAKWIRGVIPLPHEIAIGRKVVADARPLAVSLLCDSGPIGTAAAEELADVLTRKSSIKVGVNEAKWGVGNARIVLGLCDSNGKLATGEVVPGVERLSKLPNADQAYRIVPLDDRTLALTATQPQGLYYAAQTLKQLIAAGPSAAPGQIVIPLADATDWPDMVARGLWGGDVNDDMAWLAQWKINLVHSHINLSIDRDGRGVATVPKELLLRAGAHNVNLMPAITHLEQLPADVFIRFPQLKAVGDFAEWLHLDGVRPICMSQPKVEEILADWLTCLARYPEISDVLVWLAEEKIPCHCGRCAAVDPFVLQTQVVLRAWEAAKRVKPTLRLQILLTQGSYESNAKVLAAVPPEVGITYYHGSLTYDSSRGPMIYPLLVEYAGKGRSLGCMPQLTASYLVVCPWTGPQFIKTRTTEFVDKRVRCLIGYATPSDRFYEFNIAAAAEWSWNAHGRSERQFAAAWAVHQGLADPEKFADWAVMLGPVGWDVYGGRTPFFWVLDGVSTTLQSGKTPQLGQGVFTYFPTQKHFDEDLAVCDRAMRLAKELSPFPAAMIEETRVIRGFVEMLKSLYSIAEVTAAGPRANANQRKRAADALALMDQASHAVREGLLAWGRAVAPNKMSSTGLGGRFDDTVHCLDKVVTDASNALAALGIPNPEHPHHGHRPDRNR
jgi:hypothetical protein